MSDLISVIIPNYNQGVFLKRAIESVLSQTYQHFEIIVVDNHSSDQTDEIIKKFEEHLIQLYKIHNNGIIATSRNYGIARAKGKYIALLDSDDWWTKDKLQISIDELEAGYDIVYHDLWMVTKQNQRFHKRKVGARQVETPVYKDLLLRGNALPNSSVVFRHSLGDTVGYISEDTELKGVEDYDFWLKISNVTERFKFIPQVLGFYWYGGENFSKNLNMLIIGINKLLKLHEDNFRMKYNGEAPSYILFRRARTAYLLKDEILSARYLSELCRQNMSFTVRLKVYWMLWRIKFTRITSK